MTSPSGPTGTAVIENVWEIRPGASLLPPVEQPPSILRLADSKVVHVDFTEGEVVADEPQEGEVYGRSLRAMRAAGNVALQGAEVDTDPHVKQLRAEFDSAIGEMFKTAPGIGEHVTMERCEQFEVVDGRVVDESGEAMAAIIERGVHRSQEVAESSQPAMAVQAERDRADLRLLQEFVEPMLNSYPDVGHNTIFAISAYPEDGVEKFGLQFWKELGYNTDRQCAMLQMYHRSPDGRLLTRSLSIDGSSMPRLVAMLRRHNVQVPDDCSVSDLLTHPIAERMTYGLACQFMDDLVTEYEQEAGLPPKQATTEMLNNRYANLRERSFDELYLEVAKSLVAGQKTAKLSDFIISIQPALDNMDSLYRQQLLQADQSDTFDESTARLLHGVVLYSVAETVRQNIASAFAPGNSGAPQFFSSFDLLTDIALPLNNSSFAAHMGQNFIGGVVAGREYGGCGALFGFGSHMKLQQVLGGNSKPTRNHEEDAGDGLGPIEFKCSNNHWCRRPFGRLLTKCHKCNDNGESVGC